MMLNKDIIRQLEDEILAIEERVKERSASIAIENEADERKKQSLLIALKSVSEAYGVAPVKVPVPKQIDIDLPETVGYPARSRELLEKIIFFEQTINRIWRKVDFEEFVKEMEGSKKYKKIENGISPALNYYFKNHRLIKVQYGGSVIYTYYSTNSDWFYMENGVERLKEIHFPTPNEYLTVKQPEY